MRKKLTIFGHKIIIKPESDVKFHVTQFPEKIPDDNLWEYHFTMERRIDVFTQYKGFIEYVFRNYDMALLNYGDSAFLHLEAILKSFKQIRNKFEEKGATQEQLRMFDEKIQSCFNRTVQIVKNKTEELAMIESEDLQKHLKLVECLNKFNISDYYK